MRFAKQAATLSSAPCFKLTKLGTMLNNFYAATVWPGPLSHRHKAADPADSYLLDLIDAAQPDYAVTGDKRSGLLEWGTLGRTKILSATEFYEKVLRPSLALGLRAWKAIAA